MILVLFGTNPYQFNTLVEIVDRLSKSVDEEIIVQAGNSKIDIPGVKVYDFVEYEQIQQWLKECRIVITQGGFGSLKDAIRSEKPVIAVPRSIEKGESADDQFELVDELARMGMVKMAVSKKNVLEMIADATSSSIDRMHDSIIPIMVSEFVNRELNK